MATASSNNTADREIVISRLINAPQELVFDVWTDPKHIEKWWGPNGFTNTVHEMNVTPGGKWKLTMHGWGKDFPSEINYLEVVRPSKLVYTHGSGEKDDPRQFQATITFEKHGSKTVLTMRSLFKTAEVRDRLVKEVNAIESGKQTLSRFENQLADIMEERSLFTSRILDAPRELVFEVCTKPEHIKNWWGPNGFTNTITKMDVRKGGEWEFVMHGPDGTDYENKNVYVEVIKPETIVMNHVSEPEFQLIITMEAVDDKTRLNWRLLFADTEQKMKVIGSNGADEGLKQNVERLATYLAETKVNAPSTNELTIVRVFNAPPELLFKVWTDAKHLKRWFGPTGFTVPTCEADPRPGGILKVDMQGPDGTIYPGGGKYIALEEPRLIEFSTYALDKQDQPLFDTHNKVVFEAEGNGQTRMTLTVTVSNIRPEGVPYIAGMSMGWTQTLDKLNDLVNNF